MPIYCRFSEDVKFHRSLANMPHEQGVVGVELLDSNAHTLRHNIGNVILDVQNYIEQNGILPSSFVWCTREEYYYNWIYIASELLRASSRVRNPEVNPTLVPARDMPKFSLGVTKDLDIIARDSHGRWVYFEKTESNTVEVVVSDIAPDCLVFYRTSDEDTARSLSKNRYWVAVRGGRYVIVRPPINCPDDILIPYGGFLNSRFVFHGDNSYILEPAHTSHIMFVNNQWLVTYSYPRCGLYGQLVLHEDDDSVYMTLTPVYPDIFGCKFTRKYHLPYKSVFDVSPSAFCSRVANEYNINTMDDEYVDCLNGDILMYGSSPTLRHGMPTRDAVFEDNFVIEDGVPHSVWLRTMDVDSDGHRVYKNGDVNESIMTLLNTIDLTSMRDSLINYNGELYRWDSRNNAWIHSEDAVYIPPRFKRNAYDMFTHSRFVECVTCPQCHSKTMLGNRYTFIYFVDGERRTTTMCDNCISTLLSGNPLDITTEDGSVLHIGERDLCGNDDGYTLARWWVRKPDEECGFIDEYATWNHETQEWELKDDDGGSLYLASTPNGYVITERYCTHINGYFYKPQPIFFKGNSENTQKFFGIELEVMDGGETDYNAKRVCHNHEELYAKHDGSLEDGMELVSHPCTVSWHLTHLWDDVLLKLRRMRYSACSGSGIHVHVSRKYWEDNGGECRIANLITFCDMNREALRLYANREKDMFDHWTHQYLSARATRKAMADAVSTFGDTDRAMRNLYNNYSEVTDHYSVVNLSNEATVEIRAFASTLNINRMHSIIQFVDVLTELSTEATLGNPITFELIKTRAQDKGYTELLQDPKFTEAINECNCHGNYISYVDNSICS